MYIDTAYTAWSTTYDTDRNLTRDLDREVIRKIFNGSSFDSILETGCGTGKNTGFLAEIGKHVLALDFSEGMLQQARQKILAPNVAYQVADLTQPWPVPPHSMDLIACDLVLEHVENLKFIFAQASAVLKPGGQFWVNELHPFRQYRGSKAIFQHGGQTNEIPAFVHHLSDYLNAAECMGFSSQKIQEWWHADDQGKEPRLVSFLFKKSTP